MARRSLPQSPEAFIFTSTWPWPGSGRSNSLNSTRSRPGRITPRKKIASPPAPLRPLFIMGDEIVSRQGAILCALGSLLYHGVRAGWRPADVERGCKGSGARSVGAKAGWRGRLPLAWGGCLACGGFHRRRLRLRGHAPCGFSGGSQDLRRASRGHAGLLRVRDLLRPAPLRVVRALQVLQALRLEGPPDLMAELGATVPGALLRLSTEVRLYPVDGPAVRLLRERDDRGVPGSALDAHLRRRLRRHPARVRADVPEGLLAARYPGTRRTRAFDYARRNPGLPAQRGGRAGLDSHRRLRRCRNGVPGGVYLPPDLPSTDDQRPRYGFSQEEE